MRRPRGPARRSAAKPHFLEDLRRGAESVRQTYRSKGYLLDFSVDSLQEIDRFFDDHAPEGRPRPGGELADRVPGKLFSLGAYVGETLIRSFGGSWRLDSADPTSEIHVQVVLSGGVTTQPIQQVMRRFRKGAEASLCAHVSDLTGDRLPRRRAKTRWWWPFGWFSRKRPTSSGKPKAAPSKRSLEPARERRRTRPRAGGRQGLG